MININANLLTGTLTYWKANLDIPDGSGLPTFDAPVLIVGRIFESNDLIRTLQGEEVFSKGIVYLTEDVIVDSYIIDGDFLTTLIEDCKCSKILAFANLSTPSGLKTLRVARI